MRENGVSRTFWRAAASDARHEIGEMLREAYYFLSPKII